MINVKPEIRNALLANANLVSLLGGPKIYQIVAPDASVYPRITFFEFTNVGAAWTDDAETASELHIQIDIWSKSNFDGIAAEVDKTMQSLQFGRTGSYDLYEEDTAVFHKVLRYTTLRSDS
ncbi:hypothetical protein GCM10025857_34240 [Alicyclobacillus contaminans]|uniref:tail completion protein gp17 n=1 Tax=Alicyclobacillus contaminans TaxID=392016 RepID=UPI0004147119|nr:DUF3168 domain-containing protein [Alicyclobacillus contaminans]GMA52067.1 hypothetical protein GCM10025857_34240 [Alicyclobacillus contaminans]